MKIEWTDEACKAAMYAQKITTDHPIDQWREILNAATAVQFAPETDAERAKRYEAVLFQIARAHPMTGASVLKETAGAALLPQGGVT